jgi:hypothetical protein
VDHAGISSHGKVKIAIVGQFAAGMTTYLFGVRLHPQHVLADDKRGKVPPLSLTFAMTEATPAVMAPPMPAWPPIIMARPSGVASRMVLRVCS